MKRHDLIYKNIKKETERQDEKWGIQRHDLAVWLDILGEEVGEANKGYLEYNFGSCNTLEMRNELIQVAAVAAVAVQIVEQIDADFNPHLN